VLTFRLARSGRVIFSILELSPACETAATFTVAGHPGLNRVRFNGRVHGRTLESGTYQIRARTRAGGTVLHVVLVILASPPSAAQLAQARASNVCAATRAVAFTQAPFGNSELAAFTTRGGTGTRSEIVRHQNAGTQSQSSSGTPSAAPPFSPLRAAKNAANPLVIAAFAVAVLLLGLAALPQAAVPDPRLTLLLARHRLDLALAGGAALGAGLLSLALA
jgi:hypothetical protein